MSDAKLILALDLASKTGFALGPAGKIERSGTVNLRPAKGDTIKVAAGNLGCFLRDLFILDRPDAIVVEAALPPGQSRGGEAGAMGWGLYCVACSMAQLYEITLREAHNNSVRAHYLGKGKAYAEPPPTFKPNLRDDRERKRQYGKLTVIERAQLLGHIPRDCFDDNRADACSIHDYAGHTWFRAPPPRELIMHGERPSAA